MEATLTLNSNTTTVWLNGIMVNVNTLNQHIDSTVITIENTYPCTLRKSRADILDEVYDLFMPETECLICKRDEISEISVLLLYVAVDSVQVMLFQLGHIPTRQRPHVAMESVSLLLVISTVIGL